jgi:hypothetical protein
MLDNIQYTIDDALNTMFIGPCLLDRDFALWCKNNISFRISQSNTTIFILLMLVDAFMLHVLLDPHIVLDFCEQIY